ncbi:uncharacterized protein [Miscanthus floridulus]|uniref:uncharacterized protein n=1 Tax=Miscanthus floridulus TaxID=154761 RepID=UPI0034575DA6
MPRPRPPLPGTLAPVAELLRAGPHPQNPSAGHRAPPRPPHAPPAPVLLSPEPLLQPPSSSALGPVPGTLALATELFRAGPRPRNPSAGHRVPPRSPSTRRAPPSSPVTVPVLLPGHHPHVGPRYDEESSNSAVNLVFKAIFS